MKFNIKNLIIIAVSIIFFILFIVFRKNYESIKNNINDNYISFENVSGENVKSFIYPNVVSINNKDFYLVYYNNKLAVVKSNVDLEKIQPDGIYTRLIGVSKSYSENDKATLINLYNNTYSESLEEALTINDFNDYFGNYYLEVDELIDDTSVGRTSSKLASLSLEISIVCIVLFILKLVIDYKRQIY